MGASYPARVFEAFAHDAGLGFAGFLVNDRIEHAEKVTVDDDGSGDPDVGTETADHPFGDTGLAVSGRTVQEHAFARIDRRTEAVEQPLVDQQIEEGLL